MSISKFYRVSVDVPDNIADKYKESKEYERLSSEATKWNIEAGSNNYAHLEEWATFHELKDAEQCEKNLLNMIYHFSAKELKP